MDIAKNDHKGRTCGNGALDFRSRRARPPNLSGGTRHPLRNHWPSHPNSGERQIRSQYPPHGFPGDMDVDGGTHPTSDHGGWNHACCNEKCRRERVAGRGCVSRYGSSGGRCCSDGDTIGINRCIPERDGLHGCANNSKRNHGADARDDCAFHRDSGPSSQEWHTNDAATDAQKSAQKSHDGADASAARE